MLEQPPLTKAWELEGGKSRSKKVISWEGIQVDRQKKNRVNLWAGGENLAAFVYAELVFVSMTSFQLANVKRGDAAMCIHRSCPCRYIYVSFIALPSLPSAFASKYLKRKSH